MTQIEVYNIIKEFLEGYTEGINWDFKATLSNEIAIMKDILAFANSSYEGDSYLIIGVKESKNKKNKKISLNSADRKRLQTDANFLYLPQKFEVAGLSAVDLAKLERFSAEFSNKMSAWMLISVPECEFIPVCIKKKIWLYVIVVKHKPGVYICNKDLKRDGATNPEVKQGALYVRIADTTIGTTPIMATASEHVRVWKRYLNSIHVQPENHCESEGTEYE